MDDHYQSKQRQPGPNHNDDGSDETFPVPANSQKPVSPAVPLGNVPPPPLPFSPVIEPATQPAVDPQPLRMSAPTTFRPPIAAPRVFPPAAFPMNPAQPLPADHLLPKDSLQPNSPSLQTSESVEPVPLGEPGISVAVAPAVDQVALPDSMAENILPEEAAPARPWNAAVKCEEALDAGRPAEPQRASIPAMAAASRQPVTAPLSLVTGIRGADRSKPVAPPDAPARPTAKPPSHLPAAGFTPAPTVHLLSRENCGAASKERLPVSPRHMLDRQAVAGPSRAAFAAEAPSGTLLDLTPPRSAPIGTPAPVPSPGAPPATSAPPPAIPVLARSASDSTAVHLPPARAAADGGQLAEASSLPAVTSPDIETPESPSTGVRTFGSIDAGPLTARPRSAQSRPPIVSFAAPRPPARVPAEAEAQIDTTHPAPVPPVPETGVPEVATETDSPAPGTAEPISARPDFLETQPSTPAIAGNFRAIHPPVAVAKTRAAGVPVRDHAVKNGGDDLSAALSDPAEPAAAPPQPEIAETAELAFAGRLVSTLNPNPPVVPPQSRGELPQQNAGLTASPARASSAPQGTQMAESGEPQIPRVEAAVAVAPAGSRQREVAPDPAPRIDRRIVSQDRFRPDDPAPAANQNQSSPLVDRPAAPSPQSEVTARPGTAEPPRSAAPSPPGANSVVTPPHEEAALANPSVPRDIRLDLNSGGQRVEVHLAERGGDVHVAVRTPDTHLAGELRENLPSLSSRLEQSGFHSETWHTDSGQVDPRRDPQPVHTSDSGSGTNTPQNDSRRHHGERPPRQPQEPEEQSNRKQKGNEFAWFMDSQSRGR